MNQKVTKVMQRNQELESALEESEKEISQMKQNTEQVENQNMDLQLEIKNLSSTTARMSQLETELRNKLENNKSRLCSQSESMRKVEEENYTLKSEIQNLQTDIINMVNIEDSLRKELSMVNFRKKEMEDNMSQMKSQICNDTINLRHAMSENDHYKREISHLNESVSHMKLENQDMKKEIELLKEKAFSLEKQNLYLTNNVEGKDERIDELKRELDRSKSLFNTQKEITKKNEGSLRRNTSLDNFTYRTEDKENAMYQMNESPMIQYNQPEKWLSQTKEKPIEPIQEKLEVPNPLTSRKEPPVSDAQPNKYSYNMRNQSSLGYLFNQEAAENKVLTEQPSYNTFNLSNQNKDNYNVLRKQWQESVEMRRGNNSLTRDNFP